ncbi:pump protein [Escherichia coli]|nr:pump protein [Escherichia coli]EFW70275.1 Aminobenzoyl-glutamate transport protein [Escherichia coli WV_060327]EAA3116241.1 pump protein [Escherichia coli]EFO0113798.1 pump protein [Escherichia coli]EFO0118070.1 pump protein [Escherichia coli]
MPSFLQAKKSKNRFMLKYFDKPDAKPGTYFLLVLIFSVVWLLMLLAWYLVGLPTGPGIYPRLS